MNMKKISELQNALSEFMARKPVAVVGAVLCAVVVWFVIALNVYPSTPVQFNNIPLEIDLTGSVADANGLSAVSCNVEKVNVQLTGDRSQIGRLSAENLTAYIDFDEVSSAGEYPLQIRLRTDNGIAFNVDTITPTYATIKLDKIETRTYDVEASFPNIRVTAGHALDSDDVAVEPATVDITGPSAQLSAIDKVVVYSDKKQDIDSSFQLYTNQLNLYTSEGALLDQESLTLPSTDFRINIPVLTTKELQLVYTIPGVSSEETLDWLHERLQLSEETITLASQTSTAFVNDTFTVGSIRLSEVGLNFTKTFNIELDDEYINRTGIQQVTVSLDNEGIKSREFIVSSDNIQIVNPPAGYDFRVITKQLKVTIIGEADELDALSTNDILVTVDLLNYTNTEQLSSFTWPAVISFYDKEKLWAYGSYDISVDRLEKETATE
ncbi:MAG: hypothetical protein K2I93_03655 [Oscillospiraceae bacterium]|nr:hypothetical protein [Oscillospiraceae bacterium]